MAKILRSDLFRSQRWAEFVRARRLEGDAIKAEKCPTCDVEYTVFLNLADDQEKVSKILREHLRSECPSHPDDTYRINETIPEDRIVRGISN